MERGHEVAWLGLLVAVQLEDLWTTALDRAKGTVEAMPLTADILGTHGVGGLALVKLLAVAAAGTLLALTAVWTRRTGRRELHLVALTGLRIAVAAVAVVALQNAIVFTSL